MKTQSDFIVVSKEKIKKIQEEAVKINKRKFDLFLNKKVIKKYNALIDTLGEGERRDVLTSSAVISSSGDNIDKNNYSNYGSQVQTIYDMYNNRTDYGGEFLRALLDFRVSFIAGAGISIIPADERKTIAKKVIKWINNFFIYNKYYGSQFLEDVLISEMEGKVLLLVFPNVNDGNVRIRSYNWFQTRYDVRMDDKDNQRIKQVLYKKNESEAMQNLGRPKELVYIKIGGSPDRINRTIPRIANSLQDLENISRAKYDIRKNNHYFGKIFPSFETNELKEAKALQNKINSIDWQIGKAYVGTAKVNYTEPSGRAVESLKQEIVQGIKNISLNIGIPVHYMAYPELLSNRATAENLLEVINAATIKERTKWTEGITELIRKAMKIAFDNGFINFYEPKAFQVKIDLSSYATLKQVMEIWYPLMTGDIIGEDTLRSLLPGIDPEKEKKIIEAQKEENIKRFQNSVGNEMENENENEEDENEKI